MSNVAAVLAAGAPHMAPFMADECLLAMPDVDSLDYTMKEYMNYVEHIKACVERLNQQGKEAFICTLALFYKSSCHRIPPLSFGLQAERGVLTRLS